MTIAPTKVFLRAVAEFNGLVITEPANRNRYQLAKEVAQKYSSTLNLGEEQLERYVEEYQRITEQAIRVERLAAWGFLQKQ